MSVPNLKTALSGPMREVERKILDHATQIERWFRLEWQEHTPPFYSSVDLRNSGFKIAPVDTNLYPGGFNNLSKEMLPLAVQAAQSAIEKYCADAKNLLLIPGVPGNTCITVPPHSTATPALITMLEKLREYHPLSSKNPR